MDDSIKVGIEVGEIQSVSCNREGHRRRPRRKADLLTATSLLSLVPRLSLHTTTTNSNFCCRRRRAGGEPVNEANFCSCHKMESMQLTTLRTRNVLCESEPSFS